MRQSSKRVPDSAEKTVRDIRRATRRHHSAEDKIRIRRRLTEVLIENRLLKKSVLGDGEDAS